MKLFQTLFILVLVSTSCQENKPQPLIENLKYAAFTWQIGIDKVDLIIRRYIEIDKYGNYYIMRQDYNDSAKYFVGAIDNRIRKLIDNTFDTAYFREYIFNPKDSVLYCGYEYYIQYKQTKKDTNSIYFVPSQSPQAIQTITKALDTLILQNLEIQSTKLNLSAFKEKLEKVSSNKDFSILKPALVRFKSLNINFQTEILPKN